MRIKNNSGFTLVELLIAMTVVSTLMAISIVAFLAVRKTGRDSVRRQNVYQYRTGLEQFYAQNNRYPTLTEGVGVLVPNFMSSLIVDPMPSAVNPPLTYVADDSISSSYVVYTNLEMGGFWVMCSSAAGGGKIAKIDSAPNGGWTENCPL